MGKKLALSDSPTGDLCEALEEIAKEAFKLNKILEGRRLGVWTDHARKKTEARILEILDPQDTRDGLKEIWNYPVLTENYDQNQNLISHCPYVLLGAMEIDFLNMPCWNEQTRLWLKDLLHRHYPEMLDVRPDGKEFIYLPYAMNIREGVQISLIGQGEYTSRTVASLGQRVVKALSIKGAPLKVYVAADNGDNGMPEFDWLIGLRDCLKCDRISVPQAERIIKSFPNRSEENGSTVILFRGAIRDEDIYRELQKKKLSRNGNNLYVVACFNIKKNWNLFTLKKNDWRRYPEVSRKNAIYLIERLVPFRIDREI